MEANESLKMNMLAARYAKLRQLCRQLNRKRRNLRDKVDLLCRDLVYSNQTFTETLQDLRRAYDFQTELTGEFDLRYMLHKALRHLREQITQSSAAIYLCDRGDFAAHVAGAWYEQAQDIADIERSLAVTVVKSVTETHKAVLVDDGCNYPTAQTQHRQVLTGLSLMGLGIVGEDGLVGVLIIYRCASEPLSQNDKLIVEPLLTPLGRAINAAQKLEQLIVHN